ncbi:uncharacterized protein LOC119649080 isoform X2 [Hermetia illucens]|uniref:uncharacterized protein LOC119649080 isoform X2 n=1 Tax=Hermetia illucens TaxID=343691 RepID=UPI0018CC46FA|nr:uncharacterized protein LOC119649080 isoform X2 [Hermetia illucens]
MDRKRNLARRRDRWNPWEENLLIKIWAEKIGSLRGSKKNYYVYQDIARTLQGHGLRATPEKVRSKLRNLTRRYRKERVYVGPSGESTSEWPLFTAVHSILGPFTINNEIELMEDILSDDSSASEVQLIAPSKEMQNAGSPSISATNHLPTPSFSSMENDPGPMTKTNTKKRRKINEQQEILKRFDRIDQEILAQQQLLLRIDQKILKLMVEGNEMKAAFLSFLQNRDHCAS